MLQHTKLILTITIAAFCAGCEGNGPNTQNGAVAGGAIGALTGAIIGNNSGGRNGLAGALIGGTVGAIAGGTIGNSIDHQNGTIYGSEGQATSTIVVQQPPPEPAAPVEYAPPQPSPWSIWVSGFWAFNGAQYVWIAGHWETPPPGYHRYVRAHWGYRPDGSYVFIRGYWR